MDAALTLSKLRASMVVGDFDFRNNGAPLTALPAILTALNATYTRNSVKNVVQNGALVALSANQFGTSYDPVAATYGYVPEPAATNLATNSDGNAATYGSRTNVADGTAVPGFTNGIAFGDNSVERTAYKLINGTIGVVYSVSVFVIMDDGGAPVVSSNYISGDMRIMVDGYGTTAGVTRHIGNGVYRISASFTTITGGIRGYGVTKQTGQSARTFRITGIQVETGLRATSYIATTGSTASRSADVLAVPLWINNVKDSQDGSTANWTRTNCTVTTSGTAPDGTATAQLVTVSTTASTTLCTAAIKAPSAVVTYQVKVKQGSRSTCDLKLRNSTTSTDFTAGSLAFATGVITGAGWSATDLGSGWFLCTFTQSTGIAVGDNLLGYVHHTGGSYTSGGTGYWHGAQIEAGAVATTYRPTTSTLESAANANITGFSSAGYTLAVDQRMDTTLASSVEPIELSSFPAVDRALIYAGGGTTVQCTLTANSSTQAFITGGALALTRKKYAGSFAENSVMAATAGVPATPDTSATMPTGLLFLNIGNAPSGGIQYNGFIFNAKLITQALTQAQINGLTT